MYETILDLDYVPLPFRDYILKKNEIKKQIILRHDVDRKINAAMNIAKIEYNLGISSSYYFRYPHTFNPDIIAKISSMGHEIGYHYEVLAKARGNYEKAILLFELELQEFRKICPVKTICAHGSPLSRYDNRDLWKKYPFTRYGISGDAQLSIDSPVSFFTDTGRSWDMQNNLRDSITHTTITPGIRTTGDLIAHIRSVSPPILYLVIHPERWTAGGIAWHLQYSTDLVLNTGKRIIRRLR